ncbi:NUDIX hydrolase [Paenibacillus physcomitrellae]|uniref:Nudix hydrolase n=1 Tax=Paenibacillus physcomitrellae TaxID=1619311 RepID=A0ABQ1FVZ8_9BACL|nr:NUDIX domain-containing protein [Paenibacillus physcomitrellae]GGA32311.1 putative Nudix hydrolase [Paenibacillus physcomitrellae]
MSSHEMLDVYTAQRVKTGSVSRKQAHEEGLWHQTFQCWVLDKQSNPDNPGLLFQLRAEDKDTFPGKLDISCAGHLLAGETPEDGIRELQEELGIEAELQDLRYCGMVAQESYIAPDIIDREFNQVYLYESGLPLEDYRFQISEISGLFFIGLAEYKALLQGEREYAQAREGIRYDRGLDKLYRSVERFRLEDFTPNSEAHYKLLFKALGW